MNQGKYVFAQIAEFLPRRIFDRLVLKYRWQQICSLIHVLASSAQLNFWDSIDQSNNS